MATKCILVPAKLVSRDSSVKQVSMSACWNPVVMAGSVSTRKMGLSAFANLPTLERPALKVRQLVQQMRSRSTPVPSYVWIEKKMAAVHFTTITCEPSSVH